MTPSSDLFDLIISLSKSQKRYFKLFSKIHSGNKAYLKLFEVIEKQVEYNEEEIKRIFKGEVFVKQLTRTKYYLYQLILKSIRSYRTQQTSLKKLRELLDDIDFLFSIRLYDQCRKLVSRAKEMAKQYEQTTYLLEIMQWELVLAKYLKHPVAGFIKQHYSDKTEITFDMYNNGRFREIYYSATAQIPKRGFTRSKQEFERLKSYFKHPLFHDESLATSYRSRLDFYGAKATYFFYTNDFYNALTVNKKIIEILESRPVLNKERPATYTSAIQNAVTSLIHSKQFEEWPFFLEKLDRFKKEVELSDGLFIEVFNIEVAYYILPGKFENAIGHYNSSRSRLDTINYVDIDAQQRKIFYLTMSKIYFGIADFKSANTWANKLLNDSNVDMREDIYCITRMYSLIINLELNKQDLLEYSVKSTLRFLSRRNRLYKLESVILSFLKKYPFQLGLNSQDITPFKELKVQMVQLSKDPYEAKAFVFFDFPAWVESKIQKKPFAEIVRQKTN